MTETPTAPAGAGPLLRDWRRRRRLSQLELAVDAGVSARHLSFVETGRSKPSPELLLHLAARMDLPLRERNQLLLSAGYAPRFRGTKLDDRALAPVTQAVRRMLDRHDPYPGIAIDRSWNIVLANAAASRLVTALPEALLTPPLNVFRLSLHPGGFAAMTVNLEEWGTYLLTRLARVADEAGGDPTVTELVEEVRSYPVVERLSGRPGGSPPPWCVVPWQLQIGTTRISLWTTITTFGTPQDVTLDELAIELFFPSDEETEALLTTSGT